MPFSAISAFIWTFSQEAGIQIHCLQLLSLPMGKGLLILQRMTTLSS